MTALKNGDDSEEAFRRLFEIYYSRVYRSFPHSVTPQDREDLTQQVFLRIYRSMERIPEGTFEAWLLRIARTTYLHLVARRGALKRKGIEVPIDAPEGAEPLPEVSVPPAALKSALAAEALSRLRAAIFHLPDRMRRCVLLSTQGMKDREIAERLGVTRDTVKSHRAQARQRLRRDLGNDFDRINV